MQSYRSWGRYRESAHTIRRLSSISESLNLEAGATALPYGNGRSYGDCCLNDGGVLIDVSGLDRFISFDRASGIMRCESGVLFSDILDVAVPAGWFLPVTPGTQFITVGGAIANDVHGKNHHAHGTIGRFVRSFELLRSNGDRLSCSEGENREYFRATLAGLGLTGVITWAELQLKKIESPYISMESIKFGSLQEFAALCAESDLSFEHTVSWIDCVSSGPGFGRGLFMRGNHATAAEAGDRSFVRQQSLIAMPFDLPGILLNRLSMRLFNEAYYRKQYVKRKCSIVSYVPFFYPLDSILHWNRMYGKKGFFQFQCVVPEVAGMDLLLREIVKSGQASFLAVIKKFGDLVSPGILSFPRPGYTLALDFANKGSSTRELLVRLDDMVRDQRGCLYPAKDATMSAKSYKQFFPRWQEFSKYIDPNFSSTFWRRVMT